MKNYSSMKVIPAGFLPYHWHVDSMGGLGFIKAINVQSYANQITIGLAIARYLPAPDKRFKDSLKLYAGDFKTLIRNEKPAAVGFYNHVTE